MAVRALLLTLLVFATGCIDELELPPVIEASDALVLRGEEPVCAGTFPAMEARVLAVRELFDAPEQTVEYNWMLDRFPEVDCGAPNATACASGEQIFAGDLAVEHELIHAARAATLPAPLEEGLSTFLGGNRMKQSTREELGAAIEADDEFSYQRASEFVQFLVQLGGIEKLHEFELRTTRLMPFAQWQPQFEAVYGMSWPDVWAAYLESPECDPATMHDDVLLCYGGAPSIVDLTPGWMETRVYTHSMSCDSSEVVGPVNEDELRHEVAVEIMDPNFTYVWVRLTGVVVPGSRATLTRCGPCSGEPGVALSFSNEFDPLDVVPGRYVLELHQPIDAGGELGISVHD